MAYVELYTSLRDCQETMCIHIKTAEISIYIYTHRKCVYIYTEKVAMELYIIKST